MKYANTYRITLKVMYVVGLYRSNTTREALYQSQDKMKINHELPP